MLLATSRNHDLRRLGRGLWTSIGEDPQLRLRRFRGGPSLVVVELTGQTETLDAAVYVRGVQGYAEEARIDFPDARRLLLVVHLAGVAADGVRVDPTDRAGVRFAMQWWACRSIASAQALIARRIALSPGLVPSLVGPDPGFATTTRLRMPRIGQADLSESLGQVWAAAAAAARDAPLSGAAGSRTLSFVTPVYDTPPTYLDALRESVRSQGHGVELILSDDGSTRPDTRAWLDAAMGDPALKVLRSAHNCGVAAATNAALEAASGDWVGLVDHDDMLSPFAVDRLRRALADHPGAGFVFTDEVIVDAEGRAASIYCKPAFDPVLLSGVNYVNHLSLYRRDRLRAIGGLRDGYQGSQDYDLLLRYCRGLSSEEILHVPYPAYQWRQLPTSLSHAGREAAVTAARRVLTEQYAGLAGPVRVEPAPLLPDLHRLRFTVPPQPRISVVIPNRDSHALIVRLLDDLCRRTAQQPFEIIIVDNGTTDAKVLALYERYRAEQGLRVDIRPEPFNFSRMVNRGVAMARGDAILLLNNDVSVLAPDWLDEMSSCLAYPDVGIVGAKLLYPNRTIQHAGVVLGLGGLAGHWYYKAAETEPGQMGRLAVRNAMTVVTAACMLVTRRCWDDAGPFDEVAFPVAYNDVDFCARARAAGHGVVWTPFATLLHHESATRGADIFGEKARRFQQEKERLAARHGTATFDDPCFNPWLSRHRSHPRFHGRSSLPAPRSFLGGLPAG